MYKNIFGLFLLIFFLNGCVTTPTHKPTSDEVFNISQSRLPENLKKVIPALASGDYEFVENYYQGLFDAYNENPSNENDLDLAFDLINKTNQELENELNKYISVYPDSYVAYLMRGTYLIRKGWNNRGGKYINETTQSQIDGMSHYFNLALSDLDKAITLKDNDVYANCYKMDILMNYRGRDSEVRSSFNAAISSNPLSFKARSYYMTTLEPKWGGSIEEMQALVNEAKKYSKDNTNLNGLEARIYSIIGEQYWNKGNLTKAKDSYIKAASLQVGMYKEYIYSNLGRILYSQKLYSEALESFEKAIDARPTRHDAIKYKVKLDKFIKG